MTVIGYKGNPDDRLQGWIAMQVFRDSAIRLKKNYPELAQKDGERYRQSLDDYVN